MRYYFWDVIEYHLDTYELYEFVVLYCFFKKVD